MNNVSVTGHTLIAADVWKRMEADIMIEITERGISKEEEPGLTLLALVQSIRAFKYLALEKKSSN